MNGDIFKNHGVNSSRIHVHLCYKTCLLRFNKSAHHGKLVVRSEAQNQQVAAG